jgi:hypothetical protein
VGILKRAVVPLFLVLMVCAVSVYFYAEDKQTAMAMAGADNRKTVIIDAGHPALKNTKNTIDFKKIIKHRPRKCTSKLSGE